MKGPCNVTLMVYHHHQHRQNKVENGLSDGMVKMQIEIGFGLELGELPSGWVP